ncbi:MAG: hypothetical protein ACYCX3_12530 [Thermoleophilia bacterium]
MYVLGWLLTLAGLVFGVMGSLANVFLAQNYSEFWLLNLPVAVVGLGLGRYLVERGDRRSPDVSRS